MSETIGRNSIAGEQLRGFVERVEAINGKIDDLKDDRKVVMAEAQAAGLLPKGVTYIVQKRKMKPSERAEDDALKEMYLHAMGMLPDAPLFRAVGLMSVDSLTREACIESMKQFVPVGGSIEVDAGGGPKVRIARDKDGNISVTEVVEKPVTTASSDKPIKAPKPEVPNVDPAGAEQLGRQYAKADRPVIDNPFPYGDPRRARFDEGWRKETGGDGMGPDEDD